MGESDPHNTIKLSCLDFHEIYVWFAQWANWVIQNLQTLANNKSMLVHAGRVGPRVPVNKKNKKSSIIF